jgi:chromosome partitioning protein
MRTIAIVNQKGGCGKTTTAINLAAVFARRGRRTLLVDMDPQSHCAAGLGVPESSIERGIGEVLLGDLDRPTDGSDFLWEVGRHLHLAPSTVGLAALEAAAGGLSGLPDRDRRLGRLLAWLRPRFDLCVIDCPPTIGLLTFNALRAADEAIVPVETGFFSLRGAEKQLATIARTVEKLGRPLPFRLLATLYDDARPVDRDVLDLLRKRYGTALLPVVIRDHEVLREAASLGQAITEYAPKSSADADFEALADWVFEHPVPTASDAPSPSPSPLGGHAAPPAVVAPPTRAAGFATTTFASMLPQRPQPTQPQTNAPTLGLQQHASEVAVQPSASRAAELVRRVRELSVRPGREDAESSRMAQVRIAVERGLALRVGVMGDFNQWRCEDLVLRPELGVFDGVFALPPGRFRYRLVVDGREVLDPMNPARELGPDGRDASLLIVPQT